MWKYILFLPLLYYSWADLHGAESVEEFLHVVDDFRLNFPCEECRQDFNEMLGQHPFPVSEVRTMSDTRIWSWLTHNMVNLKIGKPWVSSDIMLEYTSGG